jgi:hypothetical protein
MVGEIISESWATSIGIRIQRAREPDTTSWTLEIAGSFVINSQPSTMMPQIHLPRGRPAVLSCRYIIGSVIYHMPFLLRLPRSCGEGSRHRQNSAKVSFSP